MVAAITSSGGTVTYRYKYVNAIAAEIPRGALAAVRAVAGAGAVRKDILVELPSSARDRNGSELAATIEADSAAALDAVEIAAMAEANPSGYRINNVNLNLTALHAAGFAGQNIRVAVIDSGIRPGFPHISLDNSVIGGEDLVNDGRGFSNSQNGSHGTQVAGMISANVVFTTALAGLLAPHCPSCIGPGGQPGSHAWLGPLVAHLCAPRVSSDWRSAGVADHRRDGAGDRAARELRVDGRRNRRLPAAPTPRSTSRCAT